MSNRRRQIRTTAAAVAAGAAAAGAAARGIAESRRRPTVPDAVATKEVHLVAHGGTALFVRRFRHGGGEPPAARVVFVHGWGMGADFWDDSARRLAALGLETITYDQRGHGRSETPWSLEDCTVDALARDLAIILRETAAPNAPTVLVAHSMGGMAVLRWAGLVRDEHPDGPDPVAALLWNTAFDGFLPDTFAAITRSSDPRMHRLTEWALHSTLPLPGGRAARPVIRRLGHGPGASRRAVALTHRLLNGLDPRVRVAFAPEFEQLDLRDDVAALTMPALVVTGSGDLLTPPDHGARLARELPNGALLALPGAGHQAPLDHPDLVIDLILQRLRSTVALPANHPIATTPMQARQSWSVIDGDGVTDDEADRGPGESGVASGPAA